MQKIGKQYYYTKNGKRKINSYKIYIPKATADIVGITENDKIKIYTKGNKIIIEKEK